ncbi:hypothetical protein BHE74_00035175 [Ensete ventricosum]|nr:hypothetical protein BHE74_00035175 [Ensete ventricosum]RZS12088.1 hypothetical protein BHM03_00043498 [Ensete ventricosum]
MGYGSRRGIGEEQRADNRFHPLLLLPLLFSPSIDRRQSISMVPPGSEQSTYQSTGGPVRTTRYRALPLATHEEHGSEQDEKEIRYSPRAEEAQSRAPTEKRSHKERLTTMKTRLMCLK